jgi:hypothetical protein
VTKKRKALSNGNNDVISNSKKIEISNSKKIEISNSKKIEISNSKKNEKTIPTVESSKKSCKKCSRGSLPSCDEITSKIQNILSDTNIYTQSGEKVNAIYSYLINDCTYMNCNVRQLFQETYEIGKLVGFNGTNYTALYDDGTYTHLSRAEVKEFLACY